MSTYKAGIATDAARAHVGWSGQRGLRKFSIHIQPHTRTTQAAGDKPDYHVLISRVGAGDIRAGPPDRSLTRHGGWPLIRLRGRRSFYDRRGEAISLDEVERISL